MAVDWSLDVKKFVPDADVSVIEKIVNYCGIALQSRDGQLVAFKDEKELNLVRENYLKKKLGLTGTDAELDEGIASVGQVMKASNFKNRVTVYYLLAQHFGKLDVFGGIAGSGVGGVAAGVAGAVAGGIGAATSAVTEAAADTGAAAVAGVGAAAGAVVGVGAAAAAGAGAAVRGIGNIGSATVDAITDRVPDLSRGAAYATGSYSDDEGGRGLGWLWWLLGALLLLGLIWWFFLRGGNETKPAVNAADTVATQTVEPAATGTNVATAAAGADELFKGVVAEGSAAVPVGSGTTLELRDGKPVAKVYFDTAKTDVASGFADIATKFKAYLDKNPGAILGISGFADPRGDAAVNAELSKGRAQAVQAQIVAAGIAATSTELVKPEATEQGSGDDAAARRVEVFIKPAA